MLMIFFLVQNLAQYFFNRNKNDVEPTDLLKKMGDNATIETAPRFISGSHLQNYMRPGDPYSFDAYISFYDNKIFFKQGRGAGKDADWHESGLFYDYSQSNERNMNLTIPVTDTILNNNTLYLHFQVTMLNPFHKDWIASEEFDSHGIALPTK